MLPVVISTYKFSKEIQDDWQKMSKPRDDWERNTKWFKSI